MIVSLPIQPIFILRDPWIPSSRNLTGNYGMNYIIWIIMEIHGILPTCEMCKHFSSQSTAKVVAKKQHELPEPLDLLEVWESMKVRLPLLADIALSVLNVPASSA